MAEGAASSLQHAPTMTALWLALAYAACVAGFAWLALAMETHWQQVRGAEAPPSLRTAWVLRACGVVALVLSLLACLRADHASMAALVWVLMLAGAALTVALTLSWRPRWLRVFVPWLTRPKGS
jgi:cytochrome bd-type quinol oxidase subunit 2